MLDVIEDTRNEFKIKLTDKFEQEVIAFLNTAGGNIFIVFQAMKGTMRQVVFGGECIPIFVGVF